MKKTFLGLAVLSLTLSGCGGSLSPADAALQKMHDRLFDQIVENMDMVKQPLITKAQANVTIDLKGSDNKKNIADRDFGVFSNSRLSIISDVWSDISNPKTPLVDGKIQIAGKIETPPGTLNPSVNAGKEISAADLQFSIRSVKETALLAIENMSIDSPMLPTPFELPGDMRSRWYGITFDVIDELLKKNSAETGSAPVSVREMLVRSHGNQITESTLRKYAKDMHLWKGIELLPEEGGNVRIRVESDRGKIHKAIQAFAEMMKEVSGTEFEERLERNPEAKKQLEDLLRGDAEFMKTMGSARGIISADATTFDFTGFEGEILDEKGVVKAGISFNRKGAKMISFSLTNTVSGEVITLSRDNERLRGTYNEKEYLTGTVTDKEIEVVMTEPSSGDVVMTMKLEISKASRKVIELKGGLITIPKQDITITLRTLKIETDLPKSVVLNLDSEVTLNNSQTANVQISVVKTEASKQNLELPSFVPMENLYQDLLQAFLGTATPESPTLSNPR